MLLKLHEVDTYYGHARALKGVSINIDEGEIITLLGSNGAGKSTTLLTISGIIHPRKGSVIYRGKDISREKPSNIVRGGIAHCPEGRELFPDMTVVDNLTMGAFLRRNRKSIDRDMDRVYRHFPRLEERSHQLAGSLSGGEQQMLAIARALMSNPVLLLLDEPSLGLSPKLAEQIFRIVQNINQEGISVILVEQQVTAALAIAHRGYVLDTGKIAFSGSRRELVNSDEIRKAYLGGRKVAT